MTKVFKSMCWVFLLTLLLLGVPMLARIIASAFDYSTIDPDSAFAWLFVHHIAQAVIFMGAIVAIRKFRCIDFGLRWGKVKVGQRYVLLFSLFFGLYVVGAFAVAFFVDGLQLFAYPMTYRNTIGYMSFQLLLSGPSEELIFRAFAVTMLGLVIKGRAFGGKISLANMLAAGIFGLAHVAFSFAPLKLSFSAPQVALAIALGLIYGDCYEKSGSVIYPMMMHSISNVLMVGATILVTVLLK